MNTVITEPTSTGPFPFSTPILDHSPAENILAVGQDIHILNPGVVEMLKRQDRDTLLEMVRSQIDAGAHTVDLNLGWGKTGSEKMQWAIRTIQDHFDLPLFFSAPADSLHQLLSVHRGQATINAVPAGSDDLARIMDTALEFDANLVVLLVRPGLMLASVNEKLQIAAEVLNTAFMHNFPEEKLYLDPVLSSRPDPVSLQIGKGLPDVDTVVETIGSLKEVTEGRCRTICSLSSGSQGMEVKNRSALQRRLLALLAEVGLDAAIMNCRDQSLMEVLRLLNRGEE